MKVFKALQHGELTVAPVYTFASFPNKWAFRAFTRVIDEVERQKIWLITKDDRFQISTADNHIWSCIYQTFTESVQPVGFRNSMHLLGKHTEPLPALSKLVGSKRVQVMSIEASSSKNDGTTTQAVEVCREQITTRAKQVFTAVKVNQLSGSLGEGNNGSNFNTPVKKRDKKVAEKAGTLGYICSLPGKPCIVPTLQE